MTAPSHRPIDYAYLFPWTRLLRCLRIATDPRKLCLAALAIVVLWAGHRSLAILPFAPKTMERVAAPWNSAVPAVLVQWNAATSTIYESPGASAGSLAERLLSPVEALTGLLASTFEPTRSWPQIAFDWTRLLWSLVVWALFGGAIARLAAVEFARDERIGLWLAFRFSIGRFPSLLTAPLLPLVAVLGLWGLNTLGGLMGRIPYAGEWIVSIAWGLAVVVSLLMVFIAVATAIGWPLMIAAIAVENSDAFDGFSRSFGFVYGRPWHCLIYIATALLFGMFCVALMDTLAVGTTAVAARTVASGMGEAAVGGLLDFAPGYFRANAQEASIESPEGAAVPMAFWMSIVATIAIGFATSYFWTAATAVYFLLRRADDGTHFDEVWIGEADEEGDLLPLAGIASTGQSVTERSHLPTVTPPAPAE